MFENICIFFKVFDKLKELNPKFRHKIQGIAGDCSLPGLGLSSSDRELLQTEVKLNYIILISG